MTTRFVIKAIGFSLMLWIPLLGPLGWYFGGFAWLSPAFVFVAVPFLDLVLGHDRTNEQGPPPMRLSAYHYLIPHAYVAIWLACLAWTAQLSTVGEVSLTDRAGLLVAAGIASGFATCAAHELLHRPGFADQWLARLTMAMCCYGHFVIEHLHHHANTGRLEHGTVPRPGESLYAFIARNAEFGFGNAYRVAETMRRRRGLRRAANRVVQQHGLSVVLCMLWTAAFGAIGLLLFVVQALIAIATVEMVQYFEHYGLVREDEEPLSIHHAWNSNGWLTNAITLNITRHSDHHLNAQLPYQALRMLPRAPTMPLGYFGLAWLAVIPPAWRTTIGKQLRLVS